MSRMDKEQARKVRKESSRALGDVVRSREEQAKTLQELVQIQRSIIDYFEMLLNEGGSKRIADLNKEIQTLTLLRDELVSNREAAPQRIAEARAKLEHLRGRIANETVRPQVDRLLALKAKIAALEADCLSEE